MRQQFLLSLALCGLSICAPHVRLGQTTVVGRSIPTLGQEFFGNIPFAEPPVGNLRLAPPVPRLTPTTPTINGSDYGASCLQAGLPLVSEDCLTINVLRPANLSASSSLPVMMWIYGGGFYQGAAIMYDGSAIVAQSVARGTPVIYVTFNYRLGAIGFPQGSETVAKGAANLGLKDQIVALEWVQRNIGSFGGDRRKVTIFGESTGGVSIGQLLLSPGLSRLVSGAILQSGVASTAFLFKADRREPIWQKFVAEVPECGNSTHWDTFSCLRTANESTILAASETTRLQAQEQFPFWSVIDGPSGLIPDLPSTLWQRGQFARVPFIAGTCLDEGTIFTPPTFSSTAQLREWIIANSTPSDFPPSVQNAVADRILELYPDIPARGSPFNTGNEAFGLSSQYKRASAWNGDLGFESVRRLWIQQATRLGVKAFGYLFTDPQPIGPPFLGFANFTGVFHSSDVAYTFGAVVNGSAAILSRNMIDYYVSFAASRDPNDNHGNTTRTTWQQYTPQHQIVIEFNSNNLRNIPDNYRAAQIDYLNSPLVAKVLRH